MIDLTIRWWIISKYNYQGRYYFISFFQLNFEVVILGGEKCLADPQVWNKSLTHEAVRAKLSLTLVQLHGNMFSFPIDSLSMRSNNYTPVPLSVYQWRILALSPCPESIRGCDQCVIQLVPIPFSDECLMTKWIKRWPPQWKAQGVPGTRLFI